MQLYQRDLLERRKRSKQATPGNNVAPPDPPLAGRKNSISAEIYSHTKGAKPVPAAIPEPSETEYPGGLAAPSRRTPKASPLVLIPKPCTVSAESVVLELSNHKALHALTSNFSLKSPCVPWMGALEHPPGSSASLGSRLRLLRWLLPCCSTPFRRVPAFRGFSELFHLQLCRCLWNSTGCKEAARSCKAGTQPGKEGCSQMLSQHRLVRAGSPLCGVPRTPRCPTGPQHPSSRPVKAPPALLLSLQPQSQLGAASPTAGLGTGHGHLLLHCHRGQARRPVTSPFLGGPRACWSRDAVCEGWV